MMIDCWTEQADGDGHREEEGVWLMLRLDGLAVVGAGHGW
jgi:hypothetical protein